MFNRDLPISSTKDLTPIGITGKYERVYWFLIALMPVIYRSGNIFRFCRELAGEFVGEKLGVSLAPEGKVTFRDLWKKRETYNLAALEEAWQLQYTAHSVF